MTCSAIGVGLIGRPRSARSSKGPPMSRSSRLIWVTSADWVMPRPSAASLSGRPRKFVGVHQAAAVSTRVPWRDEWETSSVPRRTLLDQKVDALLDQLAASGIDLDPQRAGEVITRPGPPVAAPTPGPPP